MLIIGSTAIKHHYPDFNRVPKDIDVIGRDLGNDTDVNLGDKKIEYLENPIILKYQSSGYLNPSLLLTLKISHLFWDINWFKHMFDVQFLLGKGNVYDIGIIDELREYWTEVHPKIKRSNLVLSKEEFFTNNINKDTEQHDYFHVLLNPIPMYTLLLKDGSEVELDENKWDGLTFDQKHDVVFEETSVMAFERYKTGHYREAYKLQMKDNIIKHFPKYISMFVIDNYKKINQPKLNYRELINKKL